MSAPTDTLPAEGSRPDPVSAIAARLRPFWWSLRRELWENRSITRGPVVMAGFMLLGFVLNHLHTLHVRIDRPAGPRDVMPAIAPYAITCAAVLGPALIIAALYSTGALLRERRDRSILFWKSLPVSNLTVVLSKAAVPMLVVPAVVFVVVIATHLLMFAGGAVGLLANGSTGTLAPVDGSDIVRMDGMLLYGLVVLALWQAPVWGWFLMVSAWAKRMPLMWAIGPWVVLSVMEKIVLGARSNYVSAFVNERVWGGLGDAFSIPPHVGSFDFGGSSPWPELHPIRFIADPELWIGLAAAAAFFAVAAWLRRRAEPV